MRHKLNNSFYFIFFQKLMEKMKLKTWTVVGNLNGESNYQKLSDETDLFDLPALKLLWRE